MSLYILHRIYTLHNRHNADTVQEEVRKYQDIQIRAGI